MSRTVSFLLVITIWAAIYVVGLGSLEIKGEEGRRILPAMTMIETGNYLVPQVGSEPYFRKPPLVNWLVAISFQLTGRQNEWTARLPSTLAVLAVAVAFLTVARASLGGKGSLAAALIWLTSFGIIEKGRLIEIEGLYVSLAGLALICWITWWHQRRSDWLTWIVPSIFLGLGLLAKGPVHLVFFYAVVVAVLCREKGLRKLVQLPHLCGIVVMLGIFAAWAVPYWHAMKGANVGEAWSAQIVRRLTGDDFKLASWLLNIPRALAYFLPWTLLLPLVLKSKFKEKRDADLFRGLFWGCALPFVAVNLLPGALPRYSMPVLPGAAWMTAMMLLVGELHPPRWWLFRRALSPQKSFNFVLRIAAVVAFAMAIYGAVIIPIALQKRTKIKPIASQIDAVIPSSETLYAIDPDYQPFLFYTKSRVVCVDRLDEVPATARYLLVQSNLAKQVLESEHWAPAHAKPILTVTDYRNRTITVAKLDKEAP
jgi:4-amino-4-deoxy-L-arabinose transferase-like glycosyltransferase